ncbi:MAG: hypothetical protein LBQ91_05040 [Oscillospiraceae bacterium]|nr:hypothetical protein [Oscillospiraceae bacterium]
MTLLTAKIKKYVFPTAAAALLLAFFAAFCVINFAGGPRFFDFDMYADTAIAKLIWEQKTLFPSGWAFGNQLYTIATPVLAALFYGITGNLNLAMSLATTLNTLLMCFAFCWAVRPHTSASGALAGLLVLVGGIISTNAVTALHGQLFYVLCSYYANYMITLFVIWGWYARTVSGKRVFGAAFAVSIVLSFLSGIQSVRQLAVVMLPLASAAAVRFVYIWIKRRAISKTELIAVSAAAAVVLANLAGILAARSLNIPMTSLYGSLEAAQPNLAQAIAENKEALIVITGLQYLAKNRTGIFLTVFAAMIIAVVCAFPVLHIKARASGRFSDGMLICAALGFVSLFGMLFANLFLDMALRPIYLFPWYALAAFSFAGIAPRLRPRILRCGLFVLCVFCACNLYIGYAKPAAEALSQDDSAEKQTAAWIADTGYDYIYGDARHIRKIAAYTNGAAAAGAWFSAPLLVMDYINRQDIYSEDDNKAAIYVFTVQNLEQVQLIAREKGAELHFERAFGDYLCYTSSEQLMTFEKSPAS